MTDKTFAKYKGWALIIFNIIMSFLFWYFEIYGTPNLWISIVMSLTVTVVIFIFYSIVKWLISGGMASEIWELIRKNELKKYQLDNMIEHGRVTSLISSKLYPEIQSEIKSEKHKDQFHVVISERVYIYLKDQTDNYGKPLTDWKCHKYYKEGFESELKEDIYRYLRGFQATWFD